MPDNVALDLPLGTGMRRRPARHPAPSEVVIINDFATAQGGATVIALTEARELRKRGFRVTWISGDTASPALAEIGVEHIALGMAPLLGQSLWKSMADGLHNRAATQAIASWIECNDHPATIYHLHNWSQILSPAVFDALRPVEDRLVVTCHDFFNLCPNGGLTHFRKNQPCAFTPMSRDCLFSQCDRRSGAHKAWRTLRQMRLNRSARFARSAATFTYLHERMEQRFAERGFEAPETTTLRNPVEPWSDHRIQAESNQGFLFVGRIGPDKGADIAVEAARETGLDLTLIGSSDQSQRGTLQEDNITFAGWRDARGIAELARTARALIVPSRIVEPFGLVVLEAAMSGLPVILSSQAFIGPEAEAAGFARTFDIGTQDQLRDLMMALAGDDALAKRMSLAGFEGARRLCHSPASWADELVKIFTAKLAAANTRQRHA